MKTVRFTWILWVGLLGSLSLAVAADPIPECLDGRERIAINNEALLKFKASQPNQAQMRANAQGVVTRVFPDRNSHLHFEIAIGKSQTEVVEIVYNLSFGPVPIEIQRGMRVQACGDFIVSSAPSRYPASPSGAVLHWLHLNPELGPNKPNVHEHGFMWIEGNLYGYDWEYARRAGHDYRRRRGNRRPENEPNALVGGRLGNILERDPYYLLGMGAAHETRQPLPAARRW